ncbi:MAG: 5-hydroxyisourate hydrolase [Rhodothermales bacterium]|jgi:5-hydroxyisourate hydrolase
MKSPITTHILDLATGSPAAGVPVDLEIRDGNAWHHAGDGLTDSDGRVGQLMPVGMTLVAGTYRLTFHTEDHHRRAGREAFHPRVCIEFCVVSLEEHYHIPLLLSPFGYSTYRGS